MASIAERLKSALELRNMTQSELSRKTGIGKSSISTYLTGEYEPKQKNIYKMALALDVNEAWFLGGDTDIDRPLPPTTIVDFRGQVPPEPSLDKLIESAQECIPHFLNTFYDCFDEETLSPSLGKSFSLLCQMQLCTADSQPNKKPSVIRKDVLSTDEQILVDLFRQIKPDYRDMAIPFMEKFKESVENICSGVSKQSLENEQNLVRMYHDLNDEGQTKLLDYADDMTQSGKYIKSDSSSLGQKQV